MDDLFREAVEHETRRKRITSAIAFLLATVAALPVGWILATLGGFKGQRRLLATLVASMLLILLVLSIIRFVQWAMGGAVTSIVSPGGSGRRHGGHSVAEALAASGRLAEATHAFEAARTVQGDDVDSLRIEAEIYSAPGGDAARAAELLHRIRRVPNASATDELYATHRLIDLYLGALNDPAKVLTELRRMADRFPNTIDGQSALAELRRRRGQNESSSGDAA